MNNKVELWISGNYVLRCILPSFPPAKLTIYNLKRMVCYVKRKSSATSDGNIVKLSFGMWKHIACQKLGLNANVCETYFDLYWQFENAKDTKEDFLMKEVSLVPFTLFLLMQLVNRKNMRDLIDDSERYPVTSTQSPTDTLPKNNENNLEIIVLKFVQRNLRDILEIISLSENDVRDYKNPGLPIYSCAGIGLKCLDDIFEGRDVDTVKNVASFLSLCKLRFDLTKDVNLKSVEKWIRCSLGSDPYAVASSSYQNTPISSNSHSKSVSKFDSRAILHNSHSAPPNRKTVILNGIVRQTVVKDNDIVFDSYTHVTNCKNSFIYLTVFLKCLVIKKCRQVSVIAKLIGETLRIHDCSDVHITAIARRVIISNCQRCTFNISTKSPPLIFGTFNENLAFGPYNSAKFPVEKLSTVDNFTDLWNQPICFQNDGTPRANYRVWSLVEPKDFKLLYLPFRSLDDRKLIALELAKAETQPPAPYQEELVTRRDKVKNWTKVMKNLPTDQCAILQNFMQERFIAWLKDHKHVEELLQLKKLESRRSTKM